MTPPGAASGAAPAAPARVALIGAGTIAASYVKGLRQTPGFEVVSICSQDGGSARAFATEHGLAAALLGELLADPAINFVLNLTPAHVHEEITQSCLESGKSVYSEKPLAATLAAADRLIALAERRGLLLACAPATFLWPPLATARRLIGEGLLGSIAGALSTMVYPGPELFHPNPAHLYGPAAGPLRDMGVYQITALMALLGPVTSVSALTSRARSERAIRVGAHVGKSFKVEVPTHIHAQLQHTSGAISSLIVSFDAMSADRPRLDLFGHDGALSLSNAHAADAVLTVRAGASSPDQIPLDPPELSAARWAIGPTSAWTSFQQGRPIETSAHRARDVLDVILAIEDASASSRVIELTPAWSWSDQLPGVAG